MPLELETKLRVPDRLTMGRLTDDTEIFDARISEPRAVAMEAFYYDTPRDALNERQWTLRIRREDGVSIGVFKSMHTIEGSVFEREELSCAAASVEEAVPLLVGLGAPAELLNMQPFVERCRIQYTRTACCLRLEDDSVCEFAADEGV
ncbi:MAG: CYTH domain-containing protein, partial [Oscillospiraceae bacterium]|nr:CYTH domain-containing protein [Oscillospiraceae bacterium]